MALDAVLLDSALNDEICTVRVYQWREATLSLGYFQGAADVPISSGLHLLPVVKRLSGGGAIIHHHEITYSCAVPSTHPLASDPRRLYWLVHERLIQFLVESNVAAALRGESRVDRSHEFLCFSRGDDFDVVIGDDKILGSAQRRRKGAVLQHGSLVLSRSRHSPQYAGIFDLAPECLTSQISSENIARVIGEIFTSSFENGSMTPQELEAAKNRASEFTVVIPTPDTLGIDPDSPERH